MISLFDCHCDTITTALEQGKDMYDNDLQLSFTSLSKYKRAVQIFAIWLDDKYLPDAFNNTIRAIDFFDKSIEEHYGLINKVTNASDLSKDYQISGILAIEGGEGIGEEIDNLYTLYSRGVRVCTLTWNRENNLGWGAATGVDKPLKPFGVRALKTMEKLGIIVDVSHLNERGFYDVCERGTKPFIASHSNTYSLCSHPRNLKDEQLKAIRDTGSMVGLNLYPPFLNENGRADMEDILRQATYMLNILGEDKLCLGCDFDGIDSTPDGIKGVADLVSLYDAFVTHMGREVTNKVFYDNMYNFTLKNL